MEFSIKSDTPEKLASACVVLGVFDAKELTASGETLDRLSKGYLRKILKQGDLQNTAGATLWLHHVAGLACERVLLVNLGKQAEFHEKQYREAVGAASRALAASGAADALICLGEAPLDKRDIAWKIGQAVVVAMEAAYRFDKYKKQDHDAKKLPKKITFLVAEKKQLTVARTAMQQGLAIAQGMKLTKDLGNLAPNICTPAYLADQATRLAKTHKLKATILDRRDMEKLGMGSFLSVARGSHQPPKFIVLEYRGADKKHKPVVLVGKGVTFDTGGISLKPGAEMDEMKYDMCGAASVLGTLQAVAEMKLPINLVGIMPTVENMPGGNASRPGDVVVSLSGQTIEILNTDAEGRLILCDALTYAERFDPAAVIDIATLTGACVIALGHVASGLLSNDDKLADELLAASHNAHDRAWRLPLWDDYQEQLKSNFADMANIGGRPGGTITAACFLARYTKKFKWAHLDIAGTAWKSGKEKGATGRPVPLLTEFLIARASK